ncbi:hypothetical protein F2Q69_00012221 [Brassica cretica]|uniref:Uncharacterized protein n=1 Tax=Brassica cretica TaxID=69181 RepID=A0A8S9QUP7_BRACR|nr:hypothetical protein F2Q69_00012221 [Brassica cretica]
MGLSVSLRLRLNRSRSDHDWDTEKDREKLGGRGELDRCRQRKMAGWPIRVCDGGHESFCPSSRSSGSLWDQIESKKSAVILDGGPNAGQRKRIWTGSMVNREGNLSSKDTGLMGLRSSTEGIMVECVADERWTGSGALSMASVLSILDGWLETKPSLFVYLDHVGMVG